MINGMNERIPDDIIFCSILPFNYYADKFAEFSGQIAPSEDIIHNRIFKNNEYSPKFLLPIQGKRVVITANWTETIDPESVVYRVGMVADAAKNEGAKEVIVNMPYLLYGRQDRDGKDDPKLKGEAHSTKVMAKNFWVNGVDKVMSVHLHSRKIYESYGEVFFKEELNDFLTALATGEMGDVTFNTEEAARLVSEKKEELGRRVLFNINPNPLTAHYLRFRSSLAFHDCDRSRPLSIDEIRGYDGSDIVFISPDKGAKYHIYDLQRLCFLEKSQYCNLKKLREAPNDPDKLIVELDEFSENFDSLEGKIVIFGDDMVDTGGTIKKSYKAIMSNTIYGTPKAVFMTFTHPVLAGKEDEETQQKLYTPDLREIVTYNTIPHIESRRITRWRRVTSVLRLAEMNADVLKRCVIPGKEPRDVYQYNSLDELMAVNGLYYLKGSSSHFLGKNR